jgi:hypothetical protein
MERTGLVRVLLHAGQDANCFPPFRVDLLGVVDFYVAYFAAPWNLGFFFDVFSYLGV